MSTAPASILTLTTDFGLDDPFVGAMKGVIAGICPEARVIDVTHGVEAFNILDGAVKLWQVARYFPSGTIHVAVVDPGVGSERRPLLAKIGAQWFLAPDNGLLTWVLDEAEAKEVSVWQLENTNYFLPEQSHTFHGRDIFAPCAAHLARGTAPSDFGRQLMHLGEIVAGTAPLVSLDGTRARRISDDQWEGRVLLIDRFGNLLTNLRGSSLPQEFELEIGGHRIRERLANYAEGKPGIPFAIVGSSGLLEIAVPQGSARDVLQVCAGATVRLLRRIPAGQN
jgi:S-adenosylmethionine hydrolase